MEKIEQIAKTVHSIHLAYCEIMNLKTQPKWSDLKEEHKQTVLNGVEKILSGEIKSILSSHLNFIKFKESNGWVYGKEYSIKNKTNPRLTRNYSDLPIEDRIKESLFFNCVKSFM